MGEKRILEKRDYKSIRFYHALCLEWQGMRDWFSSLVGLGNKSVGKVDLVSEQMLKNKINKKLRKVADEKERPA